MSLRGVNRHTPTLLLLDHAGDVECRSPVEKCADEAGLALGSIRDYGELGASLDMCR